MLTCIVCSKDLNGGGSSDQQDIIGNGTPTTKQAVKSLTSQVLIYN